MITVPFTLEYTGVEEQEAVAQVLRSGRTMGDGPLCKAVEHELSELTGARHVLMTTSCTHALEMAMLALDLKPGDEVIMPSFTFVSTANCVVLRGATPVFAEVRPDTLNLDPDDVRKRITPRTRAILPVHYAGVGCAMDELGALAHEHGLVIVEDAAQGVDAYYKGGHLGAIGDIGCFSFHGTKNISCGEGGALITSNDELAERARIIHEKGTNRSAFLRGLVDKYTWVDRGSSYVLSDVLAAILNVQLKKRAEIRRLRGAAWQRYYEALLPLAEQGRITLPTVPAECEQNYHIFYFLLPDPETRDKVLKDLNQVGVKAVFHYVPLHSSPYGVAQGWGNVDLPITEVYSRTLLRLPLFAGITSEQVEYVITQTVAAITRHVQRQALYAGAEEFLLPKASPVASV